jgi:enoyl-CoA hydratase/carnithine racemase
MRTPLAEDADLADTAPAEVLRIARAPRGIVVATLNRPGARNALSHALLAALRTLQRQLAGDRDARVLILAGAGTAFCAGHDLREIQALPDARSREALFALCSEVMLGWHALPQPVIAQVHGVATAAGCQLAASCDLVVAEEGARFATPGVSIGLFCTTPAVALSRVVAARQALEMLLTGDMVDAASARDLGLVNRVVPAAQLESATLALARAIADRSAYTVGLGKQAFYRQLGLDPAAAYAYAGEVMARNLEAADAREGIAAFLGKRAPVWRDG